MVLVPTLTLACVFQADKFIPENATPIIKAIESFRAENGRYPETLETLSTTHLAKIPDVRFSIIQPLITYRITDGKPYLSIPW